MCTPNTNRFLVRSWCYFGSKRFHNGLIVISKWSVIKSLGMWFLEICVRITRVSFRKRVYIAILYMLTKWTEKGKGWATYHFSLKGRRFGSEKCKLEQESCRCYEDSRGNEKEMNSGVFWFEIWGLLYKTHKMGGTVQTTRSTKMAVTAVLDQWESAMCPRE